MKKVRKNRKGNQRKKGTERETKERKKRKGKPTGLSGIVAELVKAKFVVY